MLHCIAARILEPLLRLLWPASGRHRTSAGVLPAATPPMEVPSAVARPRGPVLPGADGPLVRPYFVAHEAREEARRQRVRRRALWLAVHGIDIGPRLIHGVEVAA